MISLELLRAAQNTIHDIVVPGRVHRIQLTRDNFCITLWNVHNYGLSAEVLKNILDQLTLDLEHSLADPLHRSTLIDGDFNFSPDEDKRYNYMDPATTGTPHRTATQFHKTEWMKILGKFLEIQNPSPTHFTSASATASRIDRFFVSTPSWHLAHIDPSVTDTRNPRRMRREGLSDHAPD